VSEKVSTRDYYRLVASTAWARTRHAVQPWFRRATENLIRSAIGSAGVVVAAVLALNVVTKATVISLFCLTLIATGIAGLAACIMFVINLPRTAYEFYSEMCGESLKWKDKLDWQIRSEEPRKNERDKQHAAEIAELKAELARLQGGLEDQDIARLLLAEMQRNTFLKGRSCGEPECLYLDRMIERCEVHRLPDSLLQPLYRLRQCTMHQNRVAHDAVARSNSFQGVYLPRLEVAERAVMAFLAGTGTTDV
jgi:hypothetical protein